MRKVSKTMNGTAPHENIRIKVTELLLREYKKLLRKFASATGRKDYIILEKLLENEEFIPLILPQEIYTTKGEQKRVDMAFGKRIVFELKATREEFNEAYHKALEEYLPSPKLRSAEYFLITNYDYWRIYQIERVNDEIRLIPISKGDIPKNEAKTILETQILPRIEPKVPAHPDTIRALFTIDIENIIKNMRNIFNKVITTDETIAKPLYEAYKGIMRMLYGEASEDFFEDLFVRHTIMHIIALASLTRALDKNGNPVEICSGTLLDVDVSLPYLNWWRIVATDPKYENIKSTLYEILNELVLRVNLIDWDYSEAEDVFRLLYEFLVDPDTRRKIGEYYTPLWIVEYILNEFTLKDKVLMDPFCGSGTFLVLAFYKKVNDEKEDVNKAYSSLVGFDVNPLAVAIARAELILAYFRKKGVPPSSPPHIYHCDSLATWFEGEAIGMPRIVELFRNARNYLDMLFNLRIIKIGDTHTALKSLTEIENGLSKALRYAFYECGLNKDCLIRAIDKYLSQFLNRSQNLLTRKFLEHAKSTKLSEKLASLIIEYRGNSVWSSVLTSIYAPLILTRIKPNLIVTNPPWIPTTEFQALYSSKIREHLSSIINNTLPNIGNERSTSIINGSDIATGALAKAVDMALEGIGFVMNREQAFYHRNPMPAGLLATYAVLKGRWKGSLKLVDIEYDAFKHGIYPALIIGKREGETENLLVASISKEYKDQYSKSLHLTQNLLEIKQLDTTYDDYIKPSVVYFTEDVKLLTEKLDVINVLRQGLYIRGLLGGEKHKEKQEYAGLVLEDYKEDNGEFEFKLSKTENPLRVPTEWLKQYSVNIYKMIYVGEIYPFYVYRILPVILAKDEDSLRGFLERAIDANKDKLSSSDIEKIRTLISELKQPSRPKTLSENSYYVVYRCDRAFVATMIKPEDGMIIESHVSALECPSKEKALYYTAVLNYLAYKVIENGLRFGRHQFARPAQAIITAGLEWENVNGDIRKKIVELCENLIGEVEKREFYNKGKALRYLAEHYSEFKEIIKLLDETVDNDRLKEALKLVSG